MKSSILLNIIPCGPFKANRCFEGRCLHLQGRRISRTGNQLTTCFRAGFLLGSFLDPEDGGYMLFRNVGWLATDYKKLYSRRYNSSSSIFSNIYYFSSGIYMCYMGEENLTGLLRPYRSRNYVINSSLQVYRWTCIGRRIFLWCFSILVSTQRQGYVQWTSCSSTWGLPVTDIRITWFDASQSAERKLARSAQLLSGGSQFPNAEKTGISDERNFWARGSPQSEKWANVKINNGLTHTCHTSPNIASWTYTFWPFIRFDIVLIMSSAPGVSDFLKTDSWC
jgi:hypothetical protein